MSAIVGLPSVVKTGRIIAREFGVKKCSRHDAREVYDWMKQLDLELLKPVPYEQLIANDAMNHTI